MISLQFKNKTIQLPESFSELSGKQFIGIADLVFSGGDFLKCQVHAIRILGNIPRWRFLLINTEFIDRCREYTNWVFDPDKLQAMTDQLIPIYKRLYGPISGFDNMVMTEFHFSEMAYRRLVVENVPEALEELISILYRPAKYPYNKVVNQEGDVRIPFNKNETNIMIRKIARWPEVVKHAIFIWYDNCRQALINNNPLVFDDPNSDFVSQFDTGLYGMMRSLAGDKLGTIDKIENMYVHTALLEIGLIREEEAYIEDKFKSKQHG
jgi:hypothetical protein